MRLSNIIWGLAIDPGALPWWPVAFFIGLVAGFCAKGGLFKSWWKVVVTGFLVALTAAIVSTPIAVYMLRWHHGQRLILHHRLPAPDRAGCACKQSSAPTSWSNRLTKSPQQCWPLPSSKDFPNASWLASRAPKMSRSKKAQAGHKCTSPSAS